MRSVIGLLWALGGAVAGLAVGIAVGLAITKLTNMTTREGAAAYFVGGIGLLCALLGLVAGLALYGKSAPAGEAIAYSGSGVLGVVGLVAAAALGLWAFLNLREAPLKYDGAFANLELELKLKTTDLPADDESRWLNIEVQTTKTRPEGTVLWSNRRVEGPHTIIPVVQGPLFRANNRMIVVRYEGKQTELFSPSMKRTPDPAASWSEWSAPEAVDPPSGVTPAKPLSPIFALRYRLSVYGQ